MPHTDSEYVYDMSRDFEQEFRKQCDTSNLSDKFVCGIKREKCVNVYKCYKNFLRNTIDSRYEEINNGLELI